MGWKDRSTVVTDTPAPDAPTTKAGGSWKDRSQVVDAPADDSAASKIRAGLAGYTYGLAGKITGAAEHLVPMLGDDADSIIYDAVHPSEMARPVQQKSLHDAVADNQAVFDKAESDHPGYAMAGALLAPAPAIGEAATLGGKALRMGLVGADMGGLNALGHSHALNEGDFDGAIKDLARGGATGAALGVGGSAIAAGLGAAGSKLVESGLNAQRAAQAEAAIQSSGRYGAEVQKGNRLVENLIRLEGAGAMTPAQSARLNGLREAGVVRQLEQRLADSNLESLPGQADRIERARLGQQMPGAEEVAPEASSMWSKVQSSVPKMLKNSLAHGVGGAVGGLMGGPVGAIAGAGVAWGAKKAMSDPRAQGMVGRLLQTPEMLGPFAGPLMRAAQEGPQSVAVTHTVLSEMSPEYRQRMREASGSDD